MLSSYKVIKKNSVIDDGGKEINTLYNNTKNKELGEKNARDFIDNYEVLARTMVENARRQGEKILSKAFDEAQQIEQDAYQKGYEKGMQEGYEESYQKGIEEANSYYDTMKKQAQMEADMTAKNADSLLLQAKDEYIRYLEEKKDEIKDLILSISENILKKEIKDKDAIGNMILDAMEMAVKSKTIIVKCRSSYVEDVKEKIKEWKNTAVYRGEVFVAADDNLEEGCAVIQRENGKIVVDINNAIEKVREMLITE
ncbi:FliH/SctL family protein [Clostridium sp. ZS2-4]|uniref:FliH/SctL family protein n=1 Tax=Clostridium sp. ZS2-4 TaxID=2987703 RepID=UPI00227C1944|nr:fliH protein [Clostridium sp. ZS2-4]MCY6354002.1 fliH protein [Clostridium sp. ZS2-4]